MDTNTVADPRFHFRQTPANLNDALRCALAEVANRQLTLLNGAAIR
jgi:hypothetical protein